MKNKLEFRVEVTKELGRFVRAQRKTRGLTLETVSRLGNFSPRFLSEFERGKETAEIGKVLKALRVLGLEGQAKWGYAPIDWDWVDVPSRTWT
jgi:transcriptional regulator with XRE-family HTH domain